MYDQASGLRKLAQEKKSSAKTIVITSGKGGVGKSSFAVNFALSLGKKGKRVAILDADLGLANLDLLLGMSATYNLKHLLEGQKRLSEIILSAPYGVKLIPGGSGIVELANLSELKLKGLIEAFGVLDPYLDYFIIDTGAGINKQVLAFALAADEVFVVTTPEPTAQADAYGIINVLQKGNLALPVNIVVNQADSIFHGEMVYQRLKLICKKFAAKDVGLIGIIPSDITVSKAIRHQVPLIIYQPKSKAAVAIDQAASCYLAISASTLSEKNQVSTHKGFSGFLERMARLLR